MKSSDSEDSLDSFDNTLFEALASGEDSSPPRKKRNTADPDNTNIFSTLTDTCMITILSRLSAEDLNSLSQTNRYFRTIASDPIVWRGLYHARWPAGPSEDDQSQRQHDSTAANWKTLYMQRDASEVAATTSPDPILQEIYMNAHRARRAEPLSAEQAKNLFIDMSKKKPELFDYIAAFRRESETQARMQQRQQQQQQQQQEDEEDNTNTTHGDGTTIHNNATATTTTKPSSSSSTTQLHNNSTNNNNTTTTTTTTTHCQQCIWVPLNNTPHFICKHCYQVHVCSAEQCTEGRIDEQSGQLVCTITGRCFQRLLTDAGGNDGGDDGGDWNAAEEGMGGRLGRAFFAGYNADERQMLHWFNVRL